MRMCHEYVADALPGRECVQDRGQMGIAVRSGIDDRDVAVPEEIGIGAPECHRRGVGGKNAAKIPANRLRDADGWSLSLIKSHRSSFQ